jgi:hypothetical protein
MNTEQPEQVPDVSEDTDHPDNVDTDVVDDTEEVVSEEAAAGNDEELTEPTQVELDSVPDASDEPVLDADLEVEE